MIFYLLYFIPFLYLVSLVFNSYKSKKNLLQFGNWAIVTGATDGIGKSLSFELAKNGLNILLIARNSDKLKSCSNEIKEKWNVEVDYLDVDFSTDTYYTKVEDKIRDLDIGILYNNVGMSYSFPKEFSDLTTKEINDMIMLNINSVNMMTKIVVNKMKTQKRGAIINISSGAGEFPSPLLSVYSSSKQYVTMFSRSLSKELEKYNILVQSQTPLYVTSKLSKIKKESITVPSPDKFAKMSVENIGSSTVVSPYWVHSIQLGILKCIPEFIRNKVIYNIHNTINRKAINKYI